MVDRYPPAPEQTTTPQRAENSAIRGAFWVRRTRFGNNGSLASLRLITLLNSTGSGTQDRNGLNVRHIDYGRGAAWAAHASVFVAVRRSLFLENITPAPSALAFLRHFLVFSLQWAVCVVRAAYCATPITPCVRYGGNTAFILFHTIIYT